MARRPTYRPWTRLIALAVLIVAAYATIIGAGYTTKLGLDLAGGTTVTLKPKSLEGNKQPSTAALDQAVDIIRNRVNGKGVGGATVVKQYPYIVVSVPGGNRADVLNSISRTAQLYFREVATGCSTGTTTTSTNCIETDESLIPPSVLASASAAESKAAASESAAAAKASKSATPTPSSSATATPSTSPPQVAPASGATTPAAGTTTSPALTPSTPAVTTVPAATSGAAIPTATASGTATAHARPLSAALAAATPGTTTTAPAATTPTTAPAATTPTTAPAATTPTTAPAATTPTTAPAGAAPTPTLSATPAPTATSNGVLGPLPPGTGQFSMTEAQARAAFETVQCGVSQQRDRVADFAPTSWAIGCGTGYNTDQTKSDINKYLLMPAGVVGTSVSSAEAEPQTTGGGTTQVATGEWQVVLSFKDESFYNFTSKTAGGTLQGAIVLDGIVESAPTNTTAIEGQAEISGSFTQASAASLANVLKYGSLPLSFADNPTSETVSPTLGRSSLNAGLLAGLIGLGIVVVYCFIYYRALGIVTVLSLAVSGSMVYASVVLLGQAIGFTLSLSGIAGFIVAVGITADSFVVFYERVKDEVREGKRPRSAVESGWKAARRTIISADAISILAALVLYVVSIGDVRGFALTLGLSTVLDLVTVFFFTKPLVTILIQRPLFASGRMSGLSAGPQAPIRRRRPAGPGGLPLEGSA